MKEPKFFALIIGTEILNRRRNDKHFDFLTKILARKGRRLSGSFIIEDEPRTIIETISFIASFSDAVLFSFGGVGSTPDDHTRRCAATALRDGKLYRNTEAERIIAGKLGDDAYPHPIGMADLPKGAKLLENPVNKMPAFSLDERFFFMPGFPSMSHPMVETILATRFSETLPMYRYTLTALCKENELIETMALMPEGVECSSLPKHYGDGWRSTISVASRDDAAAQKAFRAFRDTLETRGIPYGLSETDAASNE